MAMAATEPKLYQIGQFVEFVEVEPPIDLTPDPQARYLWLQTEPGREMTVQSNLILRKVPFYLPTLLRPARVPSRSYQAGDDRPDVVFPLFPRTIFIAETVVNAKERCIRSTPGMGSNPFVQFGDEFAIIRPAAIQAIQYIEAGERELYYRRRKRKNAPVYIPNVGDEVSFMVEEVLGGQRGTVADVDDAGRITILMEIMKRTVRVKTTSDRIEPV